MANTQNLDLVKPLGTDHALVSVLNSNSDKIDAYAGAVNAGLDGLRDGLGILADGNTHAAITSGQFVYVKNHQTLPEGLYQATSNIAANGTLSTSNLAADPKGGLNTLSEQIGTLNSNIANIGITSSGVLTIQMSDCTFEQRGNWYRANISTSFYTGLPSNLKFVITTAWGNGLSVPIIAILDGTGSVIQLVSGSDPGTSGRVVINWFA